MPRWTRKCGARSSSLRVRSTTMVLPTRRTLSMRRAGQRLGDLGLGRLEGLRLAAGPHARDALPGDARVNAVGDGFDFGEFRHRLLGAARRLYRVHSMKIPAYVRVAMAGGVIAAGMGAAGDVGQHGPMLLVANQGDHTLSVVDTASGKQVAAIAVGGVTGHEVAASPDGRLAYVPIYGDAGVGRAGTDGNTMSVIDLAAGKVVQTVDFGHGVRPHMPLYDPASGKLYVTTELDKAITVIDPKTLKIEGQIPHGAEQSHMLVVSHDGRMGYTANVHPGSVSVLDMHARKTLAIIPTSDKTQRISITPDDRMVFTADQTQPRVAVIDTASRTVKQWIALPAIGYGSAVTADGKYLLICMVEAKAMAVIELASMKVVHTVSLPDAMGEILLPPGGKVAYVSCYPGHQVAEIDMTKWAVTRFIDVGQKGDGLAWVK